MKTLPKMGQWRKIVAIFIYCWLHGCNSLVDYKPPGTAFCVRYLADGVTTQETYGTQDCSDGHAVFLGKYVQAGLNSFAGTFGIPMGCMTEAGTCTGNWGEHIANGHFPSDHDISELYYTTNYDRMHDDTVSPNISTTNAYSYMSRLGFIADWDMDGIWGLNQTIQGYAGDFFMPGEPGEGWMVEYNIGDKVYNHMNMPLVDNSTEITYPAVAAMYHGATMESFTITSVGERMSVVWVGHVGNHTTKHMQVTILTTLDTNAMFVSISTTLKNVGNETLQDLTFMRQVDPDPDYWANGDCHSNNYVVYQPNTEGYVCSNSDGTTVDNVALVCSCGGSGTNDGSKDFAVCLGSIHPTAKATFGHDEGVDGLLDRNLIAVMSPRVARGYDLWQGYGGSEATNTFESINQFAHRADESIQLTHQFDSLAPGQVLVRVRVGQNRGVLLKWLTGALTINDCRHCRLANDADHINPPSNSLTHPLPPSPCSVSFRPSSRHICSNPTTFIRSLNRSQLPPSCSHRTSSLALCAL